MRPKTGDPRWVSNIRESINMVAQLLIMSQRKLMEANVYWLLVSGTSPFIWRPCLCCKRKRVMLRLPEFTACLSNGHLGAEGPQQVKPHTSRRAQDPQRTTQSDEILQLLLGLWLLKLHTQICSNRLTQTQICNSQWWRFITTVLRLRGLGAERWVEVPVDLKTPKVVREKLFWERQISEQQIAP